MAAKKFTEQDAVEIVRPHADRLWRISALPIYQYFETYPNLAIHSPRTRATIIHDLSVHRARLEYSNIPETEAKIIDLQIGHTLLGIQGLMLVRFKKLDEAKCSSNVQTDFIKDYDNGDTLPGLPDRAKRLTLGYRLNYLQNGLRDVFINSKRLNIELPSSTCTTILGGFTKR